MNKQPLFCVGEEVLLISETYPQYNGSYFIEGIITGEEYLKITPSVIYASSPYYYKLIGLNIELVDLLGIAHGNRTNYAREAFLRKKHKPSEFGSFTNLMNNLKLPQKTPQEVK